ncbi:MAG: AAA family ATPase, partial [Mesorhizobium sp.]
LQAIGAGAPFRAITEEIGHAELSEIRRQRVDWQREASVAFATHRTAEGLAAYYEHGDIRFTETRQDARGQIVRDYLADRDERSDGTRVAMAHRRADVRAINEAIRTELQDRGELARVREAGDAAQDVDHAQEGPGRALTFQTNDGKRDFATGDRIVFLENSRDLGVKNGMLGTVENVEPAVITVRLDSRAGGQADGRMVSISANDYQSIDHGYATTIHKNQGATVDRAYVLASGTMDRHLTYVAMTRHRDGAQLYAAQDEFSNSGHGRQAGQTLATGRLVAHGVAPYEHQPGKSDSYFVTLEDDKGQRHTIWGIDLERAMKEATPEIGDRIGLEHRGSEPVRLPDGQMVERHAWKVRDAGELTYCQLESRLSRSGVKETTLDYTSGFAERRGIAEQMGVRSEIEIPADLRVGRESTAVDPRSGDALDRRSSQKAGADLAQDLRADSREDLAQDRGGDREQRRSRFEGLKLSRVAAAEWPAAPDHDELAQDRPQGRTEPAEKQRRGMFDGLRLNASRGTSQEPEERPEREGSLRASLAPGGPAQDWLAERLRPQPTFEQAVDRYARAYESAHRQRREGLPVLDAQRQDLREAGQQLDQARPGARELMRSALRYDPDMQRSMTELSGRERVGQLIGRLDHERAMQANPNVRADRFVERWQELSRQRQQLRGWQKTQARVQVEGQMQGLAKSLERDPQVDSILRNRRQELGIGLHMRQSEGISRELEQSLTRGRSIGLER